MNKQLVAIALLALSLAQVSHAKEAPVDTTLSHELKEIVVEGERIIHKPGHDVLLLSEKNRKFGVNALEAISSMSYFKTSVGGTSLISYDEKEVFVTINGVPARGIDLCTYSADEIKK